MNRKTIIMLATLSAAVVLLAACADKELIELPVVADYMLYENDDPRMSLKVGVVPGPYGDMFMEAVYPSLKEMGYTVELVYYDDYSHPNYYLSNGQIDMNVFQHYFYLIDSKFESDLSLSAIAEIPTASMGIYSAAHRSLDDIDNGSTVSLPNDSTNFARALIVLEDADIIRLNPYIDKTKASQDDIVHNPRNIKLVPLEAHTLASTLPEYDFAVINGNYAISGGLNLSSALFTEQLGSYYYNIIAVRTEDLREQFVSDIIRVLRSDAYRAVIENPENVFSEFQRPLNFYENID